MVLFLQKLLQKNKKAIKNIVFRICQLGMHTSLALDIDLLVSIFYHQDPAEDRMLIGRPISIFAYWEAAEDIEALTADCLIGSLITGIWSGGV